jgi:hypothetical protein
MKKVIVTFYKDTRVIRTELFSNELEAELYIANESIEYDSYTMKIEEDDAI